MKKRYFSESQHASRYLGVDAPWGRRQFLQALGIAGASLACPRPANAAPAARMKHLLYVRLAGGFRFTTAFNGDVEQQFNPFGLARQVASGVQWGPSALLAGTDKWLTEERRMLGLRPVTDFADQMAVMACVDHEPLSPSADGNHQSGLERFLTGYAGGDTGIFTMLNYARREVVANAASQGEILLPAIIMGEAGMGRGQGIYAAYRPPILQGGDMSRFAGDGQSEIPQWARDFSISRDRKLRDLAQARHRPMIEAFIQSREATRSYQEIFSSDALAVDRRSSELLDGISNAELAQVFGESGAAFNVALALRLFHFGCPAVYLDQGGYDFHSQEDERLADEMQGLNHLLAGLNYVLRKMKHPQGGSYWDHTVVVAGSEFSRSTRGRRFNSAGGSDHGGDDATRYMSMPFMGGPIGPKGKLLGSNHRQTMAATGEVYSYRTVMKTLMYGLGLDASEFFPADQVTEVLWR